MAGTLQDILARGGLADLAPLLVPLGVEALEDVDVLTDEDLEGAGLSLVQARRLQALVVDRQAAATKVVEEALPAFAHAATAPAVPAPYPRPKLATTPSFEKRAQSDFWKAQMRGRPKRVIFIRHGESEANVERLITQTVPDHCLHLTERGREQALAAGERLRDLVGGERVKFIYSPYTRTRETLNGILHAWGPEASKHEVREDVRIREQEYGNFDSPEIRSMHKEKKVFGPFYYRFENGESPADCYDRASLFLESVYRSWEDNHHDTNVIVGHGMMIIVTIMRFFRIPVQEFCDFDALKNTEFVVLERPEDDAKYRIGYTWPPGEEKQRGQGGLRKKPHDHALDSKVWDGAPDSEMLESAPRRQSVVEGMERMRKHAHP